MMKRQDGMTAISILIIVAMIIYVVSLVLKVAPVYVDDASIKSVVASFEGKSDMRGALKRDILFKFNKRLKINNVTSLDKEAVSLVREGSDYVLTVEYEPRGDFIGSMEYIIYFKHEARFPAQ